MTFADFVLADMYASSVYQMYRNVSGCSLLFLDGCLDMQTIVSLFLVPRDQLVMFVFYNPVMLLLDNHYYSLFVH